MPTDDGIWTLVVHGGARFILEQDRARFAAGCAEAARVGGDVLARGGRAIDAVETAVRVLEDLPDFNAGTGSVRNVAGIVEMDAAVMDGETLAIGGVGAIRDVRHPVSVARAMLDETPILLVGDGAGQFAEHIGAEPADAGSIPASGGCDTVGCIARDQSGHVAAAGSTGGLEGKMAGRVGDTPLPGCGLYADDRAGAAALSGEGESIARGMLAAHILFALPDSGPLAAAQMAIARLGRTGGEAGAIVLDPDGGFGIAHNSEQFSVAVAAHWLDAPRAGTHADDLREWFT
ncbi:isoaspartyl peptidase/L-asparaginase [Sphingobium sp. 3R8]|uniref:isoaspartyl peptidase/L-asparaginase family protein n=1 Tax=Sphingobium sp. 3R8 TaxID=2874921 RepID=UPI001CCD333C|nr:isoaspartyl peptidase/L-asparaginase family protein [Sphingobium sp. 3R8]MBZ9648498.1 isoaspartyl peptidase/L-asparaginase [Sphingobium sp. 3R8]